MFQIADTARSVPGENERCHPRPKLYSSVSNVSGKISTGIWNKTDQTGTLLDGSLNPTDVSATTSLSGPQIEAQFVHRVGRYGWIAGAGGFDGTIESKSSLSATTIEGR